MRMREFTCVFSRSLLFFSSSLVLNQSSLLVQYILEECFVCGLCYCWLSNGLGILSSKRIIYDILKASGDWAKRNMSPGLPLATGRLHCCLTKKLNSNAYAHSAWPEVAEREVWMMILSQVCEIQDTRYPVNFWIDSRWGWWVNVFVELHALR